MKTSSLISRSLTSTFVLLAGIASAAAHPGHSPFVGLPHPGHEQAFGSVAALVAISAVLFGASWLAKRR